MKRLILLTATIFLAAHLLTAQSKYDKLFNKAEGLYKTGDYKGAYSALEKFRKKTTKKLGQQNKYTPSYYLSHAKYDLASGIILDFESNLKAAENASITINKDNSLNHAILLLDEADLLIQNGSYRVAKEYVNNAKNILQTNALLTDPLKARLDLTMGEVLSGQGYFVEALELFREREPFYAGRGNKQETFVDDKGNLKSRRLSEEEINVRFNEYARLLTDIADTYRRKGNFKSSDSAFTAASAWIDKNMSESSLAFVKNQFLYSVQIEEGGLEIDRDFPRDTGYDRALNNLKINHKNSHYLAIQIYEYYLMRLLRQGNSARYLNTKLEYEKMINGSFPKGSIYSVRLKAVEFDSKMAKDKTANLETNANNILANSQTLPHNNITTTKVLDFLYQLALEEKNYSGAEKYLNEIVDIKSNLFGEDAPEAHLARVHLANFYIDYTNKFAEAEKIYTESFTNIVEKQIDAWHKDHLDILNHEAVLYELTDKFNLASAALEKALDVARSKYRPTDYAYGAELTNSARLRLKLGQYDKAESEIKESLNILENFRKEEDKKIYLINAIETQAVLFGIKGMFDEAEDALDRSARIIGKSKNLVGIDDLATAKELSSLLIQLGKYAATEELLTDLIAEYEKLYGTNSIRLVEPLVNMGRLTLLEGDYTEADKIATRANQIAVNVYGEKSTKTAPTQKLKSDIAYTIGDWDNARTDIDKALASQEKQFGRNHVEVAKSLSQLALIKFYNGDNRKDVEKLMLESRDIMGSLLGKDNPQYAELLKNVAVFYISERKFDIAFNSLTVAESIWKAKTGTKNNINLAGIYSLTGEVYYQQKNYPKAEEFFNKAKSLYESFFSRTHPEYVKVLSKLAKVYYQQKDYKRAKKNIEEALGNYENFIKQYFPALSEREKAKYWNTIKFDFEFYNTLAFGQLEDFRDLSGKVFNYQLITKALLLSSSIKIRERILNSQDEALKSLYNEWVQQKESLTNALSMSTQQLLDNGIDTNALTADVERMERELSEKSELFGQNFDNKRITYENVQKSIDKNTVAVEMVRYRYFDHTFTDSIIYVALYVKNDNQKPKVIELPEGHRMETRFFKYFRNCITGKIKDEYSYKVFWEPIQKEIGQYATIYLSPDGVYNQINLEAIPTPDGKYVIDNSNIVIVSNTKDLYLRKVKSKTQDAAKTATMFGNPTFYLTASANKTVPPLPGTEKEVEELQALLKQKGWITDEYVEGNASEERVKELDNPKIFHIATHGFTKPKTEVKQDATLSENEAAMLQNPLLKTGLLLKGAGDVLAMTDYNYNIESGILTAYEAMNLNLDKTDLVVLSACETGLGEIANGEGVYGLQRAFLVAGAKTLIMSMFKVDDEATQKLILNFYKKWLNTGNLRQSFIDAKKELRNEYPEPYYWGPFMMIGLDY